MDLLITSLEKPVRNGVTNPYYAKLGDNSFAVVKLYNNVQGNKSLLNDFYCSNLASILGLPTPNFGICYLNNDTIFGENKILPNQYGPAFYSKLIEKAAIVTDYNSLRQISNKSDIEKILLFDYLIYNGDRNPGNLLINFKKNNVKLYAIDYSHVFDTGTIWDKYSLNHRLNDSINECDIFERNNILYDKMSKSKNIDKNYLLSLVDIFKNKINKELLSSISSLVPKEWIDDPEDMIYLEKYIFHRLNNLDILAYRLYNDIKGR